LDFSAPISGVWQVACEFVPKAPFAADFDLAFPSVLAAPAAPPVYAWRADGLQLSVTQTVGLTNLSEELFINDHWLPARVESDVQPPTRAYVRSAVAAAPLIHLRVTPESTAPVKSLPPDPKPAQSKLSAIRVRPSPAPKSLTSVTDVPVIRVQSFDIVSAETGSGRWVHLLTARLTATDPVNLALEFPFPVEPVSVAFDNDLLAISTQKTSALQVPLDQRHKAGTLRCVWLAVGDPLAPKPVIPRMMYGGRDLAPAPHNWLVVVPTGSATAAVPVAPTEVAKAAEVLAGSERLPYGPAFAAGQLRTWPIAADVPLDVRNGGQISRLGFGRLARTGSLMALIGLAVLGRRLIGALPGPELMSGLALAGWIAVGGWFWLLPIAFALAVRITILASTWRFVPRSAS
jgi:hypothetical protein